MRAVPFRPLAFRTLAIGAVRALAVLGLGTALLAVGLLGYSYTLDLPQALLQGEAPGLRLHDRNGLLLARLRGDGDVWRAPLAPADIGPHTFPVLLAAEDARFWSHPGVDALAVGRALGQALLSGRIVSGASTITQQLARTCFERPRTLWGKLHEMGLALRIERSLSKQQILVAYLNRVQFGPRITGIAAASDHYFHKPIAALDLAETALLMATVRGPSVYDLDRFLGRAKIRRGRILERALGGGLVPRVDVELALSTKAVLRPHAPWPGAWHFARKIAHEQPGRAELRSTLDWELQRRIEDLVRRRTQDLSTAGASAIAAVVIDNASAQVLAYVGSPDETARRSLGQNDGVTSRRQPGSALKPFLYAAAVDELGLTADTTLPDEALTFRTPTGHYAPDNYDRRFRGPVSVSRALSSSLNVPAVFVLDRLGLARGLRTLQEFGLTSLDREAQHYGLGLALGAGEVTLLDLTGAYSALARQGKYLKPRLLLEQPSGEGRQVVSAHAARLITSILRDRAARSEMFGRLDLGQLGAVDAFALKTGTSSGFRDAWAFVYDEELTVGIWVGNFDGRPMVETSGAAGAAPLAIAILAQARQLGSGADPGVPPDPAGTPTEAQARTEASGASRSMPPAWVAAARITFPVDGAQLLLPSALRPAEFVLRASHVPDGARLIVDDSPVPWQGDQAVIAARPGRHRARLLDERGLELSAVTFDVVAPG